MISARYQIDDNHQAKEVKNESITFRALTIWFLVAPPTRVNQLLCWIRYTRSTSCINTLTILSLTRWRVMKNLHNWVFNKSHEPTELTAIVRVSQRMCRGKGMLGNNVFRKIAPVEGVSREIPPWSALLNPFQESPWRKHETRKKNTH